MSSMRIGDVSWERMIGAVEKVRQRLQRAVRALEGAKIPYALIGGNAVAAWVSRVDESAVRNTQDVDLLLSRSDFASARQILEQAGFVHRHAAGMDVFLDGPNAKPRDAIHIIIAGEKVRPEHLFAAPNVDESETTDTFRLIELEALVRMKLTSFRDKDRTHLRDLLDVGLIDAFWRDRLPPALAERLSMLLDNPDG